MPFTLHVRNLRGLREIVWSPSEACILVGPNGSGKTTLLLVLKLIRTAYERGLPQAVTTVLGGSHELRHCDAEDDEPVEIGLDSDGLSWRLRMHPRGPTVDDLADEVLTVDGEEILRRDALGNLVVRGQPAAPQPGMLGVRYVADLQPRDEAADRIDALFRAFHVFHDPDLYALRTEGSKTTQDRHLHSRGRNALTVLRRWQSSRPDRHRYTFVVEGLQAAFPGLVEDLDFVEAGTTLVGRFYRPGREEPVALISQANGVIAMLVVLCALAQSDRGDVVAIDEPEESLHPYALRRLWELVDGTARTRGVTVLLATHHPILIDELTGRPERVFVLQPSVWPGPQAVSDLYERSWLANFRLGELQSDYELGTNQAD